jgi:hypothetical protein
MFEVAVGQHADESIALFHGQMSYPIPQHQLSGTTQAVIDFYDMRKWGHHRVRGGHAIHAANRSKVCTT